VHYKRRKIILILLGVAYVYTNNRVGDTMLIENIGGASACGIRPEITKKKTERSLVWQQQLTKCVIVNGYNTFILR
jgi:hypothetical protein